MRERERERERETEREYVNQECPVDTVLKCLSFFFNIFHIPFLIYFIILIPT